MTQEWKIGDRAIFLSSYGTIIKFRHNKQYDRELPIFQQDKAPQYFGFALPEDLHPIPEGQMELFGAIPETFSEPPDPDDFPTLNAFNNAWAQWESEGHRNQGFTTRTPQRYQYKARQTTSKTQSRRSIAAIKLENYVYLK